MGVIVGALIGVVAPSLLGDGPAPRVDERSIEPCVELPAAAAKPTALPIAATGNVMIAAAPKPAQPTAAQAAAAQPTSAQPASKPVKPAAQKAKAPPPKPAGPTYEELMQKHVDDSIDADWSESARTTVESDLAKLQEDGRFTIDSAECKKTSCVAVLKWKQVEHALAALPALLSATYELQCKKLLVPPGRSADGEVQATLIYYECTREEHP